MELCVTHVVMPRRSDGTLNRGPVLCSTPNMDSKDPDITEEESLWLSAHTDRMHIQVWAIHVSCRVNRRAFTPEVPALWLLLSPPTPTARVRSPARARCWRGFVCYSCGNAASFGWDVKPRSGLCSTPNMDGKDPDITEEENL